MSAGVGGAPGPPPRPAPTARAVGVARPRQVRHRLTRRCSDPVPTREREATVKAHLAGAVRRIGVRDRTSAALWARTHPPEDPDAPARPLQGWG